MGASAKVSLSNSFELQSNRQLLTSSPDLQRKKGIPERHLESPVSVSSEVSTVETCESGKSGRWLWMSALCNCNGYVFGVARTYDNSEPYRYNRDLPNDFRVVLVHWSLMLCLITFTNLKCNQDRHVVVFYPNWTNLPPNLIGLWTVSPKMTAKWTSLHQPQHHRRHQTSIWVWWRHHEKPPVGHLNSISLIQHYKKLDLSARPMSPMMTNQVRFDLFWIVAP